jgi:hypothetical protein
MRDENEKEAHGSKYNYYGRTRLKKFVFSRNQQQLNKASIHHRKKDA